MSQPVEENAGDDSALQAVAIRRRSKTNINLDLR
jgi:hypothetical protein